MTWLIQFYRQDPEFLCGRGTNAIDSAVYEIENLIKECCNIANRTADGILNVVFSRAEIEPSSEENDSSVLVTMDFQVTVLLGIEE